MAILKDIKFFEKGGMDLDSAIEYRNKNDFGEAYNIRTLGTQSLEEGYVTNIESNELLSASVPPGISQCIGSAGFESKRIGIGIYYNSSGQHSIREIDYDTNTVSVIPITAWPLNPSYYVNDIKLINNTFLLMNDNFNPPFYVNYDRLKAGGYTDTDPNDYMLIKAQPQFAPSGYYSNDTSRSVNLVAQKEFQFRTVWVGLDYESSCVSTISQRFVPPFESTPGQAADVSVNNNIIVTVPAGTSQTSQLLVYARYGDPNNAWFSVVTIDRGQVLTLPEAIDISNQIYQAYDPIGNTYSFVFYNDGLYQNIDPLITDQLYDAVPLVAGALEILNGNETALGDITIGYPRPTTPVLLSSSNYNPNLTLAASAPVNPFEYVIINPGQSGSGEGDHKRLVVLEFGGDIQENDYVTINLVDIRNSSNVQQYQFPPCSSGQAHNVTSYIASNSSGIPSSSTYTPSDGQTIGLNIVTSPYFKLQSVIITLANAGAGIFKSIHALKGNSAYQVCKCEYDFWGRPFPIQTDATWVVKTNSYGQSHGNTPQINWQIQNPTATPGAYTYQFGISPNNSHLTWLFMYASIIQVTNSGSGTYDAGSNVFTPAISTPAAGQAWRVSVAGSQNLGNGQMNFSVNDYVVFDAGVYNLIPSAYGDLSDSTAYYFYFNALNAYNVKYNSSILSYGYTPGDRCTLYYYDNSGTPVWFDGVVNPIVDVQVEGYDQSVFFLKVNRTEAIDPSVLLGHNVLLEVYTPKARVSTTAAGVTTNNPTVFYETGTVYPIINGQYSVLTGSITQGDNYFKTRQMGGSIDPNTLYTLLVEDPNYSDFWESAFYSFGRPRSYNDVLETTEQIANIAYSQTYIIGSKSNGLTTFYEADVYGNSGGQTTSSYGAIRKMVQINNQLIILQELDTGNIPVYINIIEDQIEQQNVAISEAIFGNIRYTNGRHIGIGKGVRSVAVYNNIIYWIDSNRNEPIRWQGGSAQPISGKMSKYFKSAFQAAYEAGLEPIGWYDIFNDEYVVSIPQLGGTPVAFGFTAAMWQFMQTFSVLPGTISITSGPTHSSASYNPISGIAVLTPAANYVGNDQMTIAFPQGSANVCFNWTAGNGNVNPFSFAEQFGVPLSTEIQSNTQLISGNDYPVAISVSGGQYSINGGAFTSSPGTVASGAIVQVQVLSSAAYGTPTSAVLSVDGQSATFEVVTQALGNFIASANYGGIIDSISGTGVPSGFTPCNLPSGATLVEPYTTFPAGAVTITLDGSPTIPGHVYFGFSVGGVQQDSFRFDNPVIRSMTNGVSASNPTLVQFYFYTMS